MEWTGFVFLMFVLKIPLGMLLWLVWWAVRQTPEEAGAQSGDDGGGGPRVDHPRPSLPHRPRRGPHGDPAPAAPARVRTTVAGVRTPER
jgi:hypothetical protein